MRIALFLVATSLFAQNATVVKIDKAEADHVASLHRSYLAAKAAFEAAEKRLSAVYVKDNGAFPCGAEFTPDFRFAVPAKDKTCITSGSSLVTFDAAGNITLTAPNVNATTPWNSGTTLEAR